jgi:RNA polymerase sigma-70 factor (ECF subfamily)
MRARTRLAAGLAAALAEDRSAEDPDVADLSRMLEVLSDDERVTMILCYAHGLSHGEIAEVIGMPIGTVKSHIRRGRIKVGARFGIRDECG